MADTDPTSAEAILRAASEQAVRERGGKPVEALEHLQQVSFILAAQLASVALHASQGYVRAGLGPVTRPASQTVKRTNPTLLEGES